MATRTSALPWVASRLLPLLISIVPWSAPFTAQAASRQAVNPVFRPLLPHLKGLMIPVLLPTYLPVHTTPRLHVYATIDDRTPNAYLVNIGYAQNCHGAEACRIGTVTGGPEVDTPTIFDYLRGRHVHLHTGALALFYPYSCGASCGDSILVFQVQGAVYTISIKAGSLHDVMAVANSVVRVA